VLGAPAGLEETTIVVGFETENEAGLAGPKSTSSAPVKFVPPIVTEVPPAVLPELGETEETVGAGHDAATPALAIPSSPPITLPLVMPSARGSTLTAPHRLVRSTTAAIRLLLRIDMDGISQFTGSMRTLTRNSL